MFVHVDKDQIVYSRSQNEPAGHENFGYLWSVPTHTVNFSAGYSPEQQVRIANMRRRISAGEKVWFDTIEEDKSPPLKDMVDEIVTGQAGDISLLQNTYRASQSEIMRAITFDDMQHSPAEQCCVDLRLFRSNREEVELTWEHQTAALAWITQSRDVSQFPYLQSMGYDYDTHGRHIDPTCPAYEPIDFTSNGFRASHAVSSYLSHVHLACILALDTPQPVVVGEGATRITIENVRVSSSLKGLRIVLPTGGVVFYRNAVLGGCGLFKFNNRDVSMRRVLLDIIRGVSNDLRWLFLGGSFFGNAPRSALTAYTAWQNASEAS